MLRKKGQTGYRKITYCDANLNSLNIYNNFALFLELCCVRLFQGCEIKGLSESAPSDSDDVFGRFM